jgi:hypothetical protein
MSAASDSAQIAQILLWYDQPEIVLLKRSALEYIIAVSNAAGDNDGEAFVGASMTLKLLSEYQNGKCDLRYTMAHANLRRYWTFEFTGSETEVQLKRVKKSDPTVIQSLPESGFFAREHDVIDVAKHFFSDTEEQFDIDGSWELNEFSRFYNQVEDIYYMFADLGRFEDPSTSAQTKQLITKAFDKPWRGGGSYLSFYDNIANDNLPTAPLKVSGIKYHSPGYVAIKAKKEPFDALVALLQGYAHRTADTRKAYLALSRHLSYNGLLKRDTTNTATPPVTARTVELANALAKLIPGVALASLVKMANNNTIIAAKVLLSIYRRVDRLYEFFEEGRVRYEGLETDPLLAPTDAELLEGDNLAG